MAFEPQKFFIGLMDFFAILLPGALLTYLFMDKIGPELVGEGRYKELVGVPGGAAFLFASYLVGHLIFLMGSPLDEVYDWLRRRTVNRQIKLLARGKALPPRLVRLAVSLMFKNERDLAVNRVGVIKRHFLRPIGSEEAIKNFQWCKTLLNLKSPKSLAVVNRFEADSKFFRCFSVVLLVLLVAWPWHRKWPLEAVPLVLVILLLALWRYMEQRHKSTNQAYWSVIALSATRRIQIPAPPPLAGGPTHAGGVVFRLKKGAAQYLLVEAKDDALQWVLPKGHIEPGESHEETAIREVLEETGVLGRIRADLGESSHNTHAGHVTTHFYLMESVGRGVREDSFRGPVWLSLRDAKACTNYLEVRELLDAADQRRERNRP